MTNEEAIINGVDFEETVSEFELLFDEWHNKEFCTMTRIRDYAEYYKEENTKLKAEIEQLKSELKQAVKLPYLAGTPLYFAFSKQGIVKDKIRRWQINEHGILFCSKGSAYPVEFIGKYAFLTREEAEQSLQATISKMETTTEHEDDLK